MRKLLYIIIFFVSLSLVYACTNEDDKIFSQSAAERMNQALADYTNALVDSENGWVMDYFATDTSPGYTLLASFRSSGLSYVAGKNEFTANVYKKDSGLFQLIGDDGPVLTFDTYNSVLHVFSDPEDPYGRKMDDPNSLYGIGLGGDYEFIVMKNNGNEINLKGKKRGTPILLTKMAAGTNWEQYFSQLDQMNTLLFNKNIQPAFALQGSNGSSLTLTNGYSHVFMAQTPEQLENSQQGVKIPFIVTASGLRFIRPILLGGEKVQNFALNEDQTKLICIDANTHAEISTDMVNFFFANINAGKKMTWINNIANMSTDMKFAYDAMNEGCVSKGWSLSQVALVYSKDWGQSLYINARKTITAEGYLSYTMTKKSTTEIDLKFNGVDSHSNPAGKNFYDNFDGVAGFANMLTSSYTVSVSPGQAAFHASILRFSSIQNPNIWFDLTIK